MCVRARPAMVIAATSLFFRFFSRKIQPKLRQRWTKRVCVCSKRGVEWNRFREVQMCRVGSSGAIKTLSRWKRKEQRRSYRHTSCCYSNKILESVESVCVCAFRPGNTNKQLFYKVLRGGVYRRAMNWVCISYAKYLNKQRLFERLRHFLIYWLKHTFLISEKSFEKQ